METSDNKEELSNPPMKRGRRDLLIPPLPDEVGLLCLARVPQESRAAMRCVSRAWRRALGRPRTPRLLISGGRPADGTADTAIWYVFDPVSRQWENIPSPSPLPPSCHIDLTQNRPWKMSDWAFCWRLFKTSCPDAEVVSMYGPNTFTLKVEEVQEEEEGTKHSRYSWSAAESMIEKSRWLYGASASEDGKFVYVAGGAADRCECSGPYLRSAERFNVERGQWEPLPPCLPGNRLYAYSCMLSDGRFCMSGALEIGNAQCHAAAGEAFDAATTWRWWSHHCPILPHSDLTAVFLKGRRYCINKSGSAFVLMLCGNNRHKRLGTVPVPANNPRGWMRLIAMGHELLVFVFGTLLITSPSVLPLQWTRLRLPRPCYSIKIRSHVVFGGLKVDKDPKSARLPVNFSLDLVGGSHCSLQELSKYIGEMV